MLSIERIHELPLHEIMPGMRGRFIHSEHMTFAFWEIDADFILPQHSHLHEQVTHMLEGEFELCVDGKQKVLLPGSVTVIPGGATHSGKSLSFCRVMDVFYPKREDYQLHG